MKKTIFTNLLFLYLSLFAAFDGINAQGRSDVISAVKEETQWNVKLINHPDVSDVYGNLSLSGNSDSMRKFFSNNPVHVSPGHCSDTRLVDSFFDIFTEQHNARDIDITLECSCCPLRCKLTIKVSF